MPDKAKKANKPQNKSSSNYISELYNRIKSLEASGVNIINFAFGAPGFDPPDTIQTAVQEYLRTRKNQLVPLDGLNDLRIEICDYIDRTRGFRPEIDQIIIGSSVKVMLFNLLTSIIKPNDEVIILDPGLPYYSRLIEFLKGKVKTLPLSEKKNFKIDMSRLSKSVSKKTKAIILMFPNNPTGNIITPIEAQKISELAQKKGLYIISDETYSQIILSGRHVSPAITDRTKNHTIILESLSYTFNIAGWGLGFYIIPKRLIESMKRTTLDLASPVPGFIQYAGIKAFQNAETLIPETVAKYKKSSRALFEGLKGLSGFKCNLPAGGIHAFPEISGTGFSSKKLTDYLLEKAGIAVLPGDIFGKQAKNHIRISFANTVDYINEGIMRLEEIF